MMLIINSTGVSEQAYMNQIQNMIDKQYSDLCRRLARLQLAVIENRPELLTWLNPSPRQGLEPNRTARQSHTGTPQSPRQVSVPATHLGAKCDPLQGPASPCILAGGSRYAVPNLGEIENAPLADDPMRGP